VRLRRQVPQRGLDVGDLEEAQQADRDEFKGSWRI
jgi:hypothetical protein